MRIPLNRLVLMTMGPAIVMKTVYNEETQMSSFLPIPETELKEADALKSQLSGSAMDWPSIDDQPLDEFSTPFLATMAFPTLFPDSQGDPTNPSLVRNITFPEKVKHLIKYAKRKERHGHIALQVILDFPIGHSI